MTTCFAAAAAAADDISLNLLHFGILSCPLLFGIILLLLLQFLDSCKDCCCSSCCFPVKKLTTLPLGEDNQNENHEDIELQIALVEVRTNDAAEIIVEEHEVAEVKTDHAEIVLKEEHEVPEPVVEQDGIGETDGGNHGEINDPLIETKTTVYENETKKTEEDKDK